MLRAWPLFDGYHVFMGTVLCGTMSCGTSFWCPILTSFIILLCVWHRIFMGTSFMWHHIFGHEFMWLLFYDYFNDVFWYGMMIWDDFKKSLWVLVPFGHIAWTFYGYFYEYLIDILDGGWEMGGGGQNIWMLWLVALLGCFVGMLYRVALSGCFAGLCEVLWWLGIWRMGNVVFLLFASFAGVFKLTVEDNQ